MEDKIDYSAIIKECVPVIDAVRMYLPVKIRHNRIPCPFHGGTEYNLGLKQKWFHCFTCGCGGDVIDFTRKLFNLSWKDAVTKLNDDFALGLPIRSKTVSEEQQKAIRQAQQRVNQSIADELAQKQLELHVDTLESIYAIVERICEDEAPFPWDEEWSPLWCEAMRLKTELKEEIDNVGLELYIQSVGEENGKRKIRQLYK